MKPSVRLGLAGFCATAIAFGPARNAYGLFLPDIRLEFGFSVGLSGLVASGLHAGYLGALVLVWVLSGRVGPRVPVVIGGLSAALGMTLVALAPNAGVLAAGVVLAGTSPGWSWSPYNDAVEQQVPARTRARVLSIVSTGTTCGIVAAGLVALAVFAWDLPWRAAWLVFAAGAGAATAVNAWALAGSRPTSGMDSGVVSGRRAGLGWLWREGAAPLFAGALSFGVVNAFYWSFAVDLVFRSGGSPLAGPLLFVVIGAAGFAGFFTGEAIARFGLRRLLAAILFALGAAAFLLGIAPAWWTAVIVSAALYGAGVMMMSALLSVWSSRVFPDRASAGFSAALLLFGAGAVVGPGVLGALAGRFGLDVAFLVAAALAWSAILIRPRKEPRPAEDTPFSG